MPEIADRVDATVDDVIEAPEAGNARTSSEIPEGPAASRSRERQGDHRNPFDGVELRMTVDHLLAGLDERDREVIHLRFTEQWTESRIAERLGVSQSYLSRMLRRILRELRRAADESGL